MMDQFKKKYGFILISVVVFYLLPLLSNSTGSFIVLLVFVFPSIIGMASLFYGIKNRLDFYFPLLVGILFIPSIFIYFNSPAWVYAIVYSLSSLFGVYIGGKIKSK